MMFDAEMNRLEQTCQEFDAVVKDSFGRSIDDEVFKAISTELYMLENEYSVAKTKMNEVEILMMELRTIV